MTVIQLYPEGLKKKFENSKSVHEKPSPSDISTRNFSTYPTNHSSQLGKEILIKNSTNSKNLKIASETEILQTSNYNKISITRPLTTNYHVFTYETGSCYVETNIYYDSNDFSDRLLEYYSRSKEQCCFDCNKLNNCLSWSYNSINFTCILKKSYRSKPVLRANFFSGFKPTGLFAIAITRGLEFRNIKNPIYSILNKSYNEFNSTEQYLYDFLILDLENQVKLFIITCKFQKIK